MHIFTSVILYINIIFIAQWLSGGNSEMVHSSDVSARLHKLCKPESIFKQTRVNFLYRESMTSFLDYVTATLRALFAWRSSFHFWTCITKPTLSQKRPSSVHPCNFVMSNISQYDFLTLKDQIVSHFVVLDHRFLHVITFYTNMRRRCT